MSSKPRIVILPGNGCTNVFRANWYGWLHKELKAKGVDCELQNMPDPIVAREKIWIPFMRNNLKCDENTILVGHSSGAEAAMRFAEQYQVRGIVLVAACVTDLGEENEKASGYYDHPWEWEKARANCGFIAQFASTDDPFIPWEEQMQVAKGLQSELKAFEDGGHFMCSEFSELLQFLLDRLESMSAKM